MPESHSETTKPLTESEIEELEFAWRNSDNGLERPIFALIATIRSLQARNRDLTVQIVNDDERSRFAATLIARDERIRALRTELERQWLDAHADHCSGEYPHPGECYWPRPALLTEEADDG